MAWRVSVVAYRRATAALLGGASMVAAAAALLLSRGHALAGAAAGAIAVGAAGATFALRVRGDLRGETLLLLTRDGCPACQEAADTLRGMQDEYGYDLWIVDVDEAPAAVRDEATASVPVVLHRGDTLAALAVEEGALRAVLAGR